MRYLIFLAVLFMSCNEAIDQKAEPMQGGKDSMPPSTEPAATNLTGCYMQVLQRDTFAASLQQRGNEITGRLSFDNYQKDGSSGTVKGTIENDIVHLHYNFFSEGMNSVMEIYFRVMGDSIVRGVGEIAVRGDTAYFVDSNNISYSGQSLKKLPCYQLPSKYR